MITSPPITVELVNDQPPATVHSKQLIHDTTGETPTWVIYDPNEIAAIAHLAAPSPTANYLLGTAGYHYLRNIKDLALWALPQQSDQ